jgi:putative nucleotidyltransferase with HDIG domain
MKCPGQDSRYWDSSAIFEVKCPACGHLEEFFKDESSRKCKKCGHRIANPKMDFGCAAYCKFAEQCVGELPVEIQKQKKDMLKDKVALEMKKYFGEDSKRIAHANKVAEYAGIIAGDLNADAAVVLCAAYLHDIGIKDAERIYNSNSAKHQELLGPDIARKILIKLNADKELIDEVCEIIGHHHHPWDNDSIKFKAVYDADQIVNIQEEKSNKDTDTITKTIEKRFLTDPGRKLAKVVLFKNI